MNNLELKSIGVQELDTNEMVNFKGDFYQLLLSESFGEYNWDCQL